MASSNRYEISSAQHAALAAQADGDGFIRFDAFMDVALYHPEEGYYRLDRQRVGQNPEADFFTASSLGPVFGELVVASCTTLLGEANPADFRFVEIGAEMGRTVLDDVEHPFSEVAALPVGAPIQLEGPCVVFSNELFDAQPCRRFRGTGEGWLELGVKLTDGQLLEASRPAGDLPSGMPAEGELEYHLDYPTGARTLLEGIAAQPWQGLFLAFDYGKVWRDLSEETPQGTVRAYHQHQQSPDLLDRMGTQDLTCHVCWDHLSTDLEKAGFSVQPVLSQEAFLVKTASSALASIMAAEAGQMSRRKSGLMQLLHPSSLGQKFQVLSGWREES